MNIRAYLEYRHKTLKVEFRIFWASPASRVATTAVPAFASIRKRTAAPLLSSLTHKFFRQNFQFTIKFIQIIQTARILFLRLIPEQAHLFAFLKEQLRGSSRQEAHLSRQPNNERRPPGGQESCTGQKLEQVRSHGSILPVQNPN